MNWESSAVKAQLRYTTQSLGQVQAKHDSQATITRSDVATLVGQGNILLAREKAEKLIQDDTFNDVLEVVEMEIGVLLERFHELEQGTGLSPVMVEAASTIIYSAPYINLKDLDVVRNLLLQRLGPDFIRSIMEKRNNYVSQRVLKAMSLPIPSAYHLDHTLRDITENHGILWFPDPPPRDFIINAVSECLDIGGSPTVDLTRLRKICLRGLPDEPAWLRPRIWKILFGLVSPIKSAWTTDLAKQREAYYDLARRLLEPFSTGLPELDDRLSEVFKELSGLPRDMFSQLDNEPEEFIQCPLNNEAPDDIRIPNARILESRLNEMNFTTCESPRPGITLEGEADVSTPGISISNFDSGQPEDVAVPKTLLHSRKCMFGTAHARHCSVLLRVLYLHNTINPASASSHTASLLVPLYSAMLQEVETEHLGHVEADTFWLLESIVAELSHVDEEGGQPWMTKLSQRLAWADYDLFSELEAQGLDPALPHYSYRWLAPLLSHTLPFPALFLAWDVLFSRGPREKGSNPKLEYLVDFCASMILQGKRHLRRIWKAGHSDHSLWSNFNDVSRNNSRDSFVESLSFLQTYNLNLVGDIDRILQCAAELSLRRQQPIAPPQASASFGSRFNFWNYSTENPRKNSLRDTSIRRPSLDVSEIPQSSPRSNMALQLTNTVLRGITNVTAMEDIPSSPEDQADFPVDMVPNQPPVSATSSPSNIWGYAERIKDSDTLATLSKVSTNWRAKGLLGGWTTPATSPSSPPSEAGQRNSIDRRNPEPYVQQLESTGLLSPPSASFRQSTPTTESPQSTGGLMDKTKIFFTTRSPAPSNPKSAPKPLLLNSSAGVTSGHTPRSSESYRLPYTKTPDSGEKDEWADVMKVKQQHFHRDSQSSMSSLSPSDAFARGHKSTRSGWESDTTSSRIVPLNRRSVSPMAPHFQRPPSRASSASSDFHSPPMKTKSPLHEISSIDLLVGHSRANPPPTTSDTTDPETSDTTSYQVHAPSRKSSSKQEAGENPDDTIRVGMPARAARVRTRRRPTNLHIQDARLATEPKSTDSSKNLKVEWPTDSQEHITTPKAGYFDSSAVARSPRRSTSKKDTYEERPRKTSTRSRKVSAENREAPKSRRESAADDGDDEGYDELLSAYESEDAAKDVILRK